MSKRPSSRAKARLVRNALRDNNGAALLRTDPSRTGTLRRAMLLKVRRQFALLLVRIAEVLPLYLTLTDNVFCPTGEGGGVDASCGKSENEAEFKVKPPNKLYRGVIGSGEAGAGTYSLGKGLYSTPTKSFLKRLKFDKIVEIDPKVGFPRNPLVLRNSSMFTDWLLQHSGHKNMREFTKEHSDPGEFVRSKGYDGVVAGDEVVKYGTAPATNANPEGCNQYKPCGTGGAKGKTLRERGFTSTKDIEIDHAIKKVTSAKTEREKMEAMEQYIELMAQEDDREGGKHAETYYTPLHEVQPALYRIAATANQHYDIIMNANAFAESYGVPTDNEYNPDQPRDERGRFGSMVAGAVQAVRAVRRRVGGLTQVASDLLPGWAKTGAATLTKAAYAVQIAGNKAALAVARERGLNEEQVSRLHKVLTTADIALGGSRSAAAMAVIGMPHLAAPAAFVPWGSVGYLAFSTAKNPLATLRAAKRAVSAAAGAVSHLIPGKQVLRTHASDSEALGDIHANATLYANSFNPSQERDEHGRFTAYHSPTKGSFVGGKPSVDVGSDYDIMGKGLYVGTKEYAGRYGTPVELKIGGKFATGEQWTSALAKHAKKKMDKQRQAARDDLKQQGYSGVHNGTVGVVWDQSAVTVNRAATPPDHDDAFATYYARTVADYLHAVGWGEVGIACLHTALDVTHDLHTATLIATAATRDPSLRKIPPTDEGLAPADCGLVREEATANAGDGIGAGDSSQGTPSANAHEFTSDPQRIRDFKAWLAKQVGETMTGEGQERAWRAYIQQGFKKGAGRAFDDWRAAGKAQTHGDEEKVRAFAGSRDDFLRTSFAHPVSRDRLEVLASRTFDDLENVTDDMQVRIGRSLMDGLVEGKSPHDVARDISDDVGISRSRAETIARSELIRSHSEGQLNALEAMGVDEVGVMVEWTTAGTLCSQLPHNGRAYVVGGSRASKGAKAVRGKKVRAIPCVCSACAPLQGAVLKIDEARNMLPRHPGCRCCWVPANVGEAQSGQVRGKRGIEDAADESRDAGGDDFSLDVSMFRPDPVVGPTRNSSHIVFDHHDFPDHGFALYGNDALPSHMLDVLERLEVVHNSNPEGCNQHTGPGCSHSESRSAEDWVADVAKGKNPIPQATHEFADELRNARYDLPFRPEMKRGVEVSIDKLEALQDWAKPENVKHLMNNPKKGEPQVDKWKGRYLIADGNHRVIAAKLRGEKTVKVTLFDQDTPPPPDPDGEVTNSNPEGHNQYTNLSTSDLRARHKESYRVLYTPEGRANGMKVKDRLALERQHRADTDELAKRPAEKASETKTTAAPPAPAKTSGTSDPSAISRVASALPASVASVSGKSNFAHLGDLHALHPELSLPDFHAAVQQARRGGKITLSGVEGRHGVSERDRKYIIRESHPSGRRIGGVDTDEQHLLYASVKK